MNVGSWRRWFFVVLLAGIFFLHRWFSSGFIVVRPGPVAFVADVVQTDAPFLHGKNLMLVSVVAKQASLIDGIQSVIDSSTVLKPISNHIPDNLSWSQYTDLLDTMMDESQRVAATVALRHLGERVEVRIEGDTLQLDLPPWVRFESNELVGASAGLMLALELYDQLTPGILAGTLRVAGTGDLRLDGSLRPVDGVPQKVVAAERNGADLFILPRENLSEAVGVGRNIRIVGVDTFEEAVRLLERLENEDKGVSRRIIPHQPIS